MVKETLRRALVGFLFASEAYLYQKFHRQFRQIPFRDGIFDAITDLLSVIHCRFAKQIDLLRPQSGGPR